MRIAFDEQGFNTLLNEVEVHKENYQNLLNETTSLDMGIKIKSIQELANLAESGEEYIKKCLEEKIPNDTNFFGFKISKRKAVNLIELPDLSRLNELRLLCLKKGTHLDRYLIVKGQTVTLAPDAVEQMRDMHSIVTTTKEQDEFYQAHQKAAEALSRLSQCAVKVYGQPLSKEQALSSMFVVEDKGVSVKDWFYRQHRFIAQA